MLVRVRAKGAYIRTHEGMERPLYFKGGTIIWWGFEEPPREGKNFAILTAREAATSEPDPRSLSPEEMNRQQEVVVDRKVKERGDVVVELSGQREIKILKAIEELDPLNLEHWTQGGLPMVEAVAELSGLDGVTRDEIKSFAPMAVRP